MREDDGGTLTVTEVTFNPTAPTNLTYNLDVAITNTYFVGNDGVLVHNGRGKDFFVGVMAFLGQQQSGSFEINPEMLRPPARVQTLSCNKNGARGPNPKKKHPWYIDYTKGKF